MYKYTYLLSDSYKQKQRINYSHYASQKQQFSSSFRNRSESKIQMQKTQTLAFRPMKIRFQNEYFHQKYSEDKKGFIEMKQKDINIDLSYHHLKLQDHNKDMSLDQRLKKLANLKNKHSQALRDIKDDKNMNHISKKYNPKDQRKHFNEAHENFSQKENHLNSVYLKYNLNDCKQRVQQKLMTSNISFRALPKEQYISQNSKFRQSRSNKFTTNQSIPKNISIKPQDQVTKCSVNDMINHHLSKNKIQGKNYPRQQLRTNTSTKESENHSKKLTDLQKRIQDSIKPYLNI